MGKKEILKFDGSSLFRTRIILATLTNQPIKIKNINIKDLKPGVKPYHVSLLKIIKEISNGCYFEFNETGTEIFFKPGILIGGAFEFHCNEQRSIGYYLEALLCVAPFVKNSIKAKLYGVTNDNLDLSVDSIKYSCLPLVKKFLNLDSELNDLDINVLRRCFPQNPKNSNENFMTESRGYDGTTRGYKTGEIVFTCPIYNANKALYKPVDLITPTSKNVMEGDEYQEQAIGDLRDDYKIVKIRGIAYTLKVSPAIANRMVNQCQLILKSVGFTNNFIRLDNCKKSQCGLNPGFGLCLFAQTANGCMYFGEACSFKSDEEYVSNTNLRPSPLKTPEDIATQATFKLLDEIYMGGSIDSTNQTLAFHLMALASNNISRILTGKITTYALKNMKLIEEILKVKFKIDKTDLIDKKLNRFEGGDENDIENTNLCPNKYIVTCLGSGFVNINKTYK